VSIAIGEIKSAEPAPLMGEGVYGQTPILLRKLGCKDSMGLNSQIGEGFRPGKCPSRFRELAKGRALDGSLSPDQKRLCHVLELLEKRPSRLISDLEKL